MSCKHYKFLHLEPQACVSLSLHQAYDQLILWIIKTVRSLSGNISIQLSKSFKIHKALPHSHCLYHQYPPRQFLLFTISVTLIFVAPSGISTILWQPILDKLCLKTPETSLQVELSPPQTPHLSITFPDPRQSSQPRLWGKQERKLRPACVMSNTR